MEWLTLLSLLAAVTAAYLSWRQLRTQQERWAIDDARIRPRGYVGSSEVISDEGWFHGVWQVTNRAPFEIEVIEVVATFPESLEIAELEPGSDGPVQLMRAIDRGKILKVNQIMPPYESPVKFGIIGSNFMFRISGSPKSNRGRSIRLQINCRELDNPKQTYSVKCEANVPQQL
jgi:hypothetical protein